MKLPPRVIVFLLVAVVLAYHVWTHPPNPWMWMQTLGVCLLAVSFPLWLTAHIQLGSSFSALPEARALVTRGLYAKFRNPIYLFGAWVVAGAFLLMGRPQLLVVFIVLIPLQIARMRREARVLEEKFGEEYRSYRRKTWL